MMIVDFILVVLKIAMTTGSTQYRNNFYRRLIKKCGLKQRVNSINKLNFINPFVTNLTNKIYNFNCIEETKTTDLKNDTSDLS